MRELIAALEEALAESAPVPVQELELGDLLFTLVNLARHLDLDPEAGLRATNAKFERRFRRMEAVARTAGRAVGDLTLAELEALWEAAKAEERRAAIPTAPA